MAEHDDSDIARVLRATGGRSNPSDEIKQSIYTAVHAEWQATVAKRQKSRRVQRMWLAAAASIAVAAVVLFVGRAMIQQRGQMVADVSRSVGTVELRDGDSGAWQSAVGTRTLHLGESVHTGPDGTLALALRDGVSLRLDHDTSIALVNEDRIDVSSGAIYVDSGLSSARAGRLVIGTPAGVVRHVGTQYEARIVDGGTRVRVREGRVDVVPAHGTARTLQVGEQVLVSGAGVEDRGNIEPSSDEWDWASNAAPVFDIDGRPAHEFLAWAGRETGLKVVFATPESAAEARRTVLSGSVAGLGPDEALAAVLPTTSLRSSERDGQLVIEVSNASP
jgi:ferric-dicitrate binding protein FerR (iron transport regulator)